MASVPQPANLAHPSTDYGQRSAYRASSAETESQPFAPSFPHPPPSVMHAPSRPPASTLPLPETAAAAAAAAVRPAVDEAVQTNPSLFLAALRRFSSSFSSSPSSSEANEQDEEYSQPDTSLHTKLNSFIGNLILRRPLRDYGWESLIVPLIGIAVLIPTLLTAIHPLWTTMYATHVSARLRLLQRQHTLHLTPSLVATLRSPPPPATLLPGPPMVSLPTNVYNALYRLCLAESPHGPACESAKRHVLTSSGVVHVLDASRAVALALDASARGIEAEYRQAKTLELDLGARNASSKELHALVEGVDEVIVRSMRSIHAAVDQAAVHLDRFREKVVKEAVLDKLRADRDRLAWQVETHQEMKGAGEVIRKLDDVMAALLEWTGELETAGKRWEAVQLWARGGGEGNMMWWVPRHLWQRIRQEELDKANKVAEVSEQTEL